MEADLPFWVWASPPGRFGSAGPPSGLSGPVPRVLIKRPASEGQESSKPFGPVPPRPGLALSDVTVTAHPWAVASSQAWRWHLGRGLGRGWRPERGGAPP